MPASLFDSAIHGGLWGDAEIGRLFGDASEIRAMLLVEGALARAQGETGLIPELSAAAIYRAAREVSVDAAALAPATAANGVPVPALVEAFRAAMQAPEHAQFVHWGATTQDIVDTALMLRLRRVLEIAESRLVALIRSLGGLAEAHATLPVAGRTYGQAATPTSFGAQVANWGWPLIRHRERLTEMRGRLLCVSLGGAAGTLSAMADKGPAVRAALARELGLADPGTSWHPARDTVAELAGWATGLAASLGKMGEDLTLAAQSGIGEVSAGAGGASSTMPQKQNPVVPSVLVALSRMVVALNGAVQGAALHRQERDASAWFTEWLALPQLLIATGRGLALAADLADKVAPDAQRMRAQIDGPGEASLGLIFAEALTFALARTMPRPEAQAEVKALCAQARREGAPLPRLAALRWPQLNLAPQLTAEAQLGEAPEQARRFAQAALALPQS